jgi:hypothetical protein
MYLNWIKGSMLLGFTFALAFILVKPIGVSTEYVVLDGIYEYKKHPTLIVKDDRSPSGYSSRNAYLNKNDAVLAKHIAEPKYYGLVFVLSMILGGFIGRWTNKNHTDIKQIPDFHVGKFKNRPFLHYLFVFLGGILMLIGARLAGGCTSGHMMSGMMQTSISGYIFALVVFAIAIPTALLFYRRRDN